MTDVPTTTVPDVKPGLKPPAIPKLMMPRTPAAIDCSRREARRSSLPPPATAFTKLDRSAMRASALRPVAAITKPVVTLHSNEHGFGIRGFEIAVTRQSPHWEEFRVAVITKIKDAREARRREALLVPEAVGALR